MRPYYGRPQMKPVIRGVSQKGTFSVRIYAANNFSKRIFLCGVFRSSRIFQRYFLRTINVKLDWNEARFLLSDIFPSFDIQKIDVSFCRVTIWIFGHLWRRKTLRYDHEFNLDLTCLGHFASRHLHVILCSLFVCWYELRKKLTQMSIG